MDPSYEYPRETVEYVYFDRVLVNGKVPTSLNLQYTLTRGLGRPVMWLPLEIHDGKFAILLDGTLPAGEYTVFVRVPEASLASVIEAGRIRLT